MKVLITGSAGNLGSLLAEYLIDHSTHKLRLMIHKREVNPILSKSNKTEIVRADLSDRESLGPATEGVDAIVHFAGVLFKARPEKFLHTTNTEYFENLVDAANAAGVKKVILISFPHVEGPTSFEYPATGKLNGSPISVHAQTRLKEEQILLDRIDNPVSLRVGMVYGRGILMVDAARWFATRRLLGVWKERTQIHLISKVDFCRSVENAIGNFEASGIYHIGDDGNVSLQEFLDLACKEWDTPPPWRMPLWMIYFAASVFEFWSLIFKTRSPLTRDFIDIGRVPYYGDTTRMKQDLIPALVYPTIFEGRETLT